MNAQDLIKTNLMVRMLGGSHAYGMSLPSSDVDYRGIFFAPELSVRTPFFPIKEVTDTTEEDTKYHELTHFMKLVVDCNPNIIELLWTDDSAIEMRTESYDHLRAHRDLLLSKKAAFTFTGYAFAQLKRIKGHNKWITKADDAVVKLSTLYIDGKVDLAWLEANFDESIVARVVNK